MHGEPTSTTHMRAIHLDLRELSRLPSRFARTLARSPRKRAECNRALASAKKWYTLLDLCVSSLRRGHANLLCIVPILTDDPRRESEIEGAARVALLCKWCASALITVFLSLQFLVSVPAAPVAWEVKRWWPGGEALLLWWPGRCDAGGLGGATAAALVRGPGQAKPGR